MATRIGNKLRKKRSTVECDIAEEIDELSISKNPPNTPEPEIIFEEPEEQNWNEKLDKNATRCRYCHYKSRDLNKQIVDGKIISECAWCNNKKITRNITIDDNFFDLNGIFCRKCGHKTKNNELEEKECKGRSEGSTRILLKAKCQKCNTNKSGFKSKDK